MPVPDEQDSSEESSLESTTDLRRSNSQRSLTSQYSTRSTYSHSNRTQKKKENNTGSSAGGGGGRPSSLFVSPPSSPRPAYRSNSTDEYYGNSSSNSATVRGASTITNVNRSTSTVNATDNEITITVPVPTTSLEKLTKLKDRLIGAASSSTNSPSKVESDDESTPLVSEVSTPSHSRSDSVFIHSFSPENSNDFSPVSSNLPQGGERTNDLDYCDSISLVIHEGVNERHFSKQNAEDCENPETPV